MTMLQKDADRAYYGYDVSGQCCACMTTVGLVLGTHFLPLVFICAARGSG
jgi:hypothetical protein